jgi:hypothetical protein
MSARRRHCNLRFGRLLERLLLRRRWRLLIRRLTLGRRHGLLLLLPSRLARRQWLLRGLLLRRRRHSKGKHGHCRHEHSPEHGCLPSVELPIWLMRVFDICSSLTDTRR